MPNVIKFSHAYRKLLLSDGSLPKHLRLLEVLPVDLADLSPVFLAYDTDDGLYKLKDGGAYLMLLFKKLGDNADIGSTNLLTTLRRSTPDKLVYYRQHIGDIFDVELIGA